MKNKSVLDKCTKFWEDVSKDAVGNKFVSDGIVDPDEYSKAKYKILWILKAVNGDFEDVDWSLCKFLANSNGLRETGHWKKTYKPVAYAAYGLLNGMPTWNQLNKLFKDDESKIIEALKQIAVINLKKTPGGGKNKDTAIAEAYEKHRKLIHCQIDALKPTIIIIGGSKELRKHCKGLYQYLAAKDSDFKEITTPNPKYKLRYGIADKRLLINVYNPAQYSVTSEVYYTSLMKAVKKGLKLLQK